jgi:hypothetical protein
MIKEVKGLFNVPEVLQKGKLVSNPEAWKRGQVTVSVIAGLLAALVAVSKAFGYEIGITDEELTAIGTSVIAIYGIFVSPTITIATTDKLGAKPKE